MSKELNKYFKSESVEIARSSIQFANYNPRKITDSALKKLKQNIKRVGMLGGIIWNERTNNLVSGHQRVTVLDQLNGYDGTDEIDFKSAGLTEQDLSIIGIDFDMPVLEEIRTGIEDMSSSYNEGKEREKKIAELSRESQIAHNKEVKQQVKDAAQKQAQDMDAYLMLSFDTFEAKSAFCERFGYDPYSKFIKGEIFDEQVERIE